MRIEHPIPPLYNSDSQILILGSFPSVKSREMKFFYGHPQNRFWTVLASLCEEEIPTNIEGKKKLVLSHGFALWDVVASCDVIGSSDSSIRNVVINDLRPILEEARINKIICNGRKAYDLYEKYSFAITGMSAYCLPSTSPANAMWSVERLVEVWKEAIT